MRREGWSEKRGVGGVRRKGGMGWSEGVRCLHSQVDNEGVADALQNILFTNDVLDLF